MLRDVFNMMPDEELSGDLIREVYAEFGLAYYHSECLHKTLCRIHVVGSFQHNRDITHPRLEEKLAQSYSLTLGQVRDGMRELIPAGLFLQLEEAVERRNFLAHIFGKCPMSPHSSSVMFQLEAI